LAFCWLAELLIGFVMAKRTVPAAFDAASRMRFPPLLYDFTN
jgi:hypothetical protein